MRYIITLLVLCTLLAPALLNAADHSPASGRAAADIDHLLDRAIAENLIAGGVVVVGNHDGIIATSSRGRLNASPGAPQLNEHTIFDIASLTKVAATTPAIIKLIDERKISLSDPISRWFPEFADGRQGGITVLNLLTHTSGLDDISVGSSQPMQSAIRKAAAERGRVRPGSRFHYADINFILLGELVHRVSGEPLNAFCEKEIYQPLGAQESMFLPPRELAPSIAPTSGSTGGTVQDGNARMLGGVAGHAGLFTSAYDLSRYARLILGGGTLDNKRIFSQQAVAQMTTPYACNNVRRGLGWDISSPYSAPKGSYFSAASFGHTGYSGSSIWIDPQQDLFVIMLTRRLNYSDAHSFNKLRRNVSTAAAGDFRMPGEDGGMVKPVEVAKADRNPAEGDGKVAEAAASSDFDVYVKDGIVVATNIPKHKQQQLSRKFAKSVTLVSHKAGAHRGRIIKLAKAESGKSLHKKRRTVAKS